MPILVVAMQGHYFIRDGEYIYETATSSDKKFLLALREPTMDWVPVLPVLRYMAVPTTAGLESIFLITSETG